MEVLQKVNILCILPVIGDTKDAKRIELLQKAGFNIKVIAFERDYFVSRLPNCEIVKLPKIEQGKYWKRLLIMLKSLIRLRRYVEECDVIYAFSPDLAIFAYIASLRIKKPLIMDVADIREIQVSNSISGWILRRIERFITNRVDLLVVSSFAFINDYYSGKLKAKVKTYLLLENKVDYSLEENIHNVLIKNNEIITIGYFGYLRDNWSIKFLLEISRQLEGKCKVKLAGVDMISDFNLDELCARNENFTYYGPYKSPDELNNIYSDIDLIVIFYPEPTDNIDWFNAKRICRSNRFYEACYFKKPIIAFSFTEDGKQVISNDIGFTLDSYDIKSNIEIIKSSLTQENMALWKYNMLSLNRSVYCLSDESTQLRNSISKIIESNK